MFLKELRTNLNKTQDEVAFDLGIKKQTYQNYELKKREPDVDMLIKLANYFDVSLDHLIGRQWQNQVGYIPDDRKELIRQLIDAPIDLIKEVQIFVNGYNAGKSKQGEVNFY